MFLVGLNIEMQREEVYLYLYSIAAGYCEKRSCNIGIGCPMNLINAISLANVVYIHRHCNARLSIAMLELSGNKYAVMRVQST